MEDERVIDVHTHIFPDVIAARAIEKLENYAHIKAKAEGTLTNLREKMKENSVNCSIIQPVVTRPEQFSSVNAFAAKINRDYAYDPSCQLISFGGLHPLSDNYKNELREIKSLGLKGIKLHPDYQKTKFDDIRYMRIISYASMLGLSILVHAGVDIGLPEPVHCTPQMAARVLDEVKPEKLILAHLGGYGLWDDVENYLVGRDVYLDTAYTCGKVSWEQYARIIKNHGVDHILFGTDSPWSDAGEDVQYFKTHMDNKEDLQKIFYGNAKRIIGI